MSDCTVLPRILYYLKYVVSNPRSNEVSLVLQGTCIYLCSIFTLVFFSVDLLTRTGLSYFTREAVGGIMLIVDSVNLHVLLVDGVQLAICDQLLPWKQDHVMLNPNARG